MQHLNDATSPFSLLTCIESSDVLQPFTHRERVAALAARSFKGTKCSTAFWELSQLTRVTSLKTMLLPGWSTFNHWWILDNRIQTGTILKIRLSSITPCAFGECSHWLALLCDFFAQTASSSQFHRYRWIQGRGFGDYLAH